VIEICSEAVYAASKADYQNKLTIALKEANETQKKHPF